MSVFKQNTFSRSLANEQKLGAYYTDAGHCERIGRLFHWPQEEVSVLEPSIGDATAVRKVLRKCLNAVLFGVELNKETVAELEVSPLKPDYLLHSDFLKGIKVSNKGFSFCFSNPPYGMDQDEKQRLERKFMEKTFSYMTDGGIYVLVIPYYVLKDEGFLKSYFARFHPLAVYRFDDEVYKQFQQIVIIGERRNSLGYLRPDLEMFYKTIDALEKLPYLPKVDEEIKNLIEVKPSSSEKIEYFTTMEFHADEAALCLKGSGLYAKLGEYTQPVFAAVETGQPPVQLKKDSLYMCAVSGAGQGLVGCEEDGTLHLQRGEARVVTDRTVASDGKGGTKLVETSRTKIVLNVIENSGRITCLE